MILCHSTNLDMIRTRRKQNVYNFQLLKTVSRLLNKLIEKRETLEFKVTQPIETFHFNPPKPIEGSWMLGLKTLEV